MLSNLSNNPPWPGSIIPLSFTLAWRLYLDSIKSPIVPKILTIIATNSQFEFVNGESIK